MNLPPLTKHQTDDILLGIYRQSEDTRILGWLYEKYYTSIYQYCLYWVKDSDHAFDLTQNAFLKSIDKLDQLKQMENYGYWLRSIAYNSTMSFLKQQKREVNFKKNLGEFSLNQEEKEVKQKEAQLLNLERAIGQLPQPVDEMLKLKYQENKSIAELQELYDLSESAVKMRLARARKKVRQLMQDAA